MLRVSLTISWFTPLDCMGIRLLTPARLKAGFSSILKSVETPFSTEMEKLALDTIYIPFLMTSDGYGLNALLKSSMDWHP